MFRIFRDARLQERFEQDGFVKVPFLTPDDVALLREHYFEIVRAAPLGAPAGNGAHGVFVNPHAQDAPGRPRTIELFRRLLPPRIERHCVDWEMHAAGYWSKMAGSSDSVVPHQDGTLVDDEQLDDLFQLTFWIALGDYTAEEGSLGFIKGSHRFFDGVICSPGQVAPVPSREHRELLVRYLTFPELRAGEAFAFNTRTIHAALPNQGTEPRICAAIALTPRNIQQYYYFMKPGTTDRALKIAIDDEFHSNKTDMHKLWLSGRIPEVGRVVGELTKIMQPSTAAEVEALCIRHR